MLTEVQYIKRLLRAKHAIFSGNIDLFSHALPIGIIQYRYYSYEP